MKKLFLFTLLTGFLAAAPLYSASAITADQWNSRVVNGKPLHIAERFEDGSILPLIRKVHTIFGNFAQSSYDANVGEVRHFTLCVRKPMLCAPRESVDPVLQTADNFN